MLFAAATACAQFRPIKEVHPQSVSALLKKFGHKSGALNGEVSERVRAQIDLINYERKRIEALRLANDEMRRQGASCDEVKAQEAYFIDSSEAAEFAMGIGLSGFGIRADESFRRTMVGYHRQLRQEYARYDMLNQNLSEKLAAEAEREEKARRMETTLKSSAPQPKPNSSQSASATYSGPNEGWLDDSTIFLIVFVATGIWFFSINPSQSGFFMRWLQGAWVTVLWMVVLGYLNGGPRGAAGMLGISTLSGPAMGFLFACFSTMAGYAAKDTPARGRGGRKSAAEVGHDFGYDLGTNLVAAIFVYLKIFGIPAAVGLLYYFNKS